MIKSSQRCGLSAQASNRERPDGQESLLVLKKGVIRGYQARVILSLAVS